MHWLDRIAVFGTERLPPEKRAFADGWGSQDVIDRYLAEVDTVPEIESATLVERPARRSGGTIVRDISFPSPHLETGPIATVRARWVTTRPEPQRVVVLFAAWNDEDYRTRTKLARQLLEDDIASVIVQHPFYGDRRRDRFSGSPITTVSDFCLMGRAAVLEGRALLATLHERGYQLGVSGYSMGGNIAGFVSSTVPFPIATAPVAASYSPGPVFSDGILRSAIHWEALGGDRRHVARRLWEVLGAASILDFPPPPHLRAAVLLAATKDGFVPNATTLSLHRHWPGSSIDWVNAGHATLLWRNKTRMAASISESFQRLDALTAAEHH